MTTLKNHSQNKESQVVLNYFGGRTGLLLDIGAYDGISLSNSYDLIRAGWKGVMFEPDKRSFDCLYNLYKNNKQVEIFNIGIAKKTGEHKFFIDSMLSTLYEDQKKDGEEYRDSTAHFVSWKDFYTGQQFNFVTIDAEGADLEILEQMNLDQMRTECLCIEHNGNEEMLEQIISYCGGMKEICRNNENLILTL